jgi:hypothetical protein
MPPKKAAAAKAPSKAKKPMATKKVAAPKAPSKAKYPIQAKLIHWDVAVGATARIYAHFTIKAESFDVACRLAKSRMEFGLPPLQFDDIQDLQMDEEPEISNGP